MLKVVIRGVDASAVGLHLVGIEFREALEEVTASENRLTINDSEGDSVTRASVEGEEVTALFEGYFCEKNTFAGVIDSDRMDSRSKGGNTIREEGKGIGTSKALFLEEIEEDATGFNRDVDQKIPVIRVTFHNNRGSFVREKNIDNRDLIPITPIHTLRILGKRGRVARYFIIFYRSDEAFQELRKFFDVNFEKLTHYSTVTDLAKFRGRSTS